MGIPSAYAERAPRSGRMVRVTAIPLLIGTYTERKPFVDGHAPGLLEGAWDDGRITDVRTAAVVENPSWAVRSRDGTRVYCVLERERGGVAGFARDEAGAFTPLGEQDSGGADPAHLALHPGERLLAVANYSGGTVAILPLGADGAPQPASSVHHQPAPDAPTPEQNAPHPHHVEFDPVTGDLLVADLGLDRVCVLTVSADGALDAHPDRDVILPHGTGPRQLAFDETGDRLFVLGELGCTVTPLRRTSAGFVAGSPVSTLPPGVTADGSSAGAVRYSPTRGRLYATTRGHDSVAVVDTTGDALRVLDVVPSGGRTPRAATLTPEGRLVVAHQDDDAVVTFELDDEGIPVPVDRIAIPSPVCLVVG